ncbi:hypothetical protein LY78DRAFT_157136 [Colletotrichum sublineola]|nr:hypothetical protein LY78DRAFT_157136 [Colletotrichum sublineola]
MEKNKAFVTTFPGVLFFFFFFPFLYWKGMWVRGCLHGMQDKTRHRRHKRLQHRRSQHRTNQHTITSHVFEHGDTNSRSVSSFSLSHTRQMLLSCGGWLGAGRAGVVRETCGCSTVWKDTTAAPRPPPPEAASRSSPRGPFSRRECVLMTPRIRTRSGLGTWWAPGLAWRTHRFWEKASRQAACLRHVTVPTKCAHAIYV